jgi:predicted membrane chloride channel (bestrophin family)
MDNLRKLEAQHEACAHILYRLRQRVDQVDDLRDQMQESSYVNSASLKLRLRMAKMMGSLLEQAYQDKMNNLCCYE